MKKTSLGLIVLVGLAGCDPAPAGDEYFDNVNQVYTTPEPLGTPNGTDPVFAETLPQTQESLQSPPPGQSAEGVPGNPAEFGEIGESGTVNTPSAFDPSATAEEKKKTVLLNEPTLVTPSEEKKPKKVRKNRPAPKVVAASTGGIDLATYAQSQKQLVGQKVYNRSASKYANGGNCDQYSVPEIAQTVFLNAGGPKNDKLLLDKDGDGFACAWTPNQYR